MCRRTVRSDWHVRWAISAIDGQHTPSASALSASAMRIIFWAGWSSTWLRTMPISTKPIVLNLPVSATGFASTEIERYNRNWKKLFALLSAWIPFPLPWGRDFFISHALASPLSAGLPKRGGTNGLLGIDKRRGFFQCGPIYEPSEARGGLVSAVPPPQDSSTTHLSY